MKKINLFGTMLLAFGAMVFTACNNENPIVEDVNAPYVPGIPMDDIATPNPELDLSELNTVIPNLNYTVDDVNGWAVIRLDLTGVKDPYTNDWVKLYGPGSGKQNVWLSLDGAPKGFSIHNTAEGAEEQQVKAVDLVFLIDNSGSMDQEANALANEVYAWASKLAKSDLDMRFAVVGYDGCITGGMNFGTIEELDAYLNEPGRWGTSRTMHFVTKEGDDWNTWVSQYWVNYSMDECEVAALRLADEQFSFRPGANRVYVNFTDEPNYFNSDQTSVEYVNPANGNWGATQGTIHTVFSESYLYSGSCYEDPKLLSDYTGGTYLQVPYDFSGVTLDDLPITGALMNSYIIKFTNCEEVFDGQPHNVKITVKSQSPNGEILADKEFNLVFEKE
jgi:hypothetical protein